MSRERRSPVDASLAKEATSLLVRAPDKMRARLVLYIMRGSNGCWLWMGTREKDGYGRFCFDYKTFKPYRLTYEWVHGSFPAALMPDHLCRNPPCVNPSHIEPVTPRENVLRGRPSPPKTNYEKVCCKHGHPFTTENTYFHDGARQCKTCTTRLVGEYRARNRKPRRTGSARKDAKLNEEMVRGYRQRLNSGESKVVLAKEAGVSPKVMYDIDRGITWKHVNI